MAPVPDHLPDEDVLGALRRIPDTYQQVILLSDVQEMTYKEIASALNIPIGTVMSRLHRGRELLRVALGSSAASTGQTRRRSVRSFVRRLRWRDYHTTILIACGTR